MVKSLFTICVGIVLTLILWWPIFIQTNQFYTVSDQSLTEGVVEDFLDRGVIDNTYSRLVSWYTYPRIYPDGLTLHYPVHLYAIGVIGTVLFGGWMSVAMPFLALLAIVWLVKGITEEVWQRIDPEISEMAVYAAWIGGISVLSLAWLDGFRFELFFVTFMLAGIYAMLRFFSQRSFVWLVVAGISLAFAMVLRQNYTLFAGSLLLMAGLQALAFTSPRQWGKVFLVMAIFPLVIVGSYYTVFIKEAGTISYYSQSGYPVLDEQVFQPEYLDFQGVDAELNQEIDREQFFETMYGSFNNQYPSLRNLVAQAGSLDEMYHRLNQNLLVRPEIFVLGLFLAGMYWYAKRSPVYYLALGLLVPYVLTWAVYTSNPRYLHVHMILWMGVVITGVFLSWNKIYMLGRVVLMGAIIVILGFNVHTTYAQYFTNVTHIYWGEPNPTGLNAMPHLMTWIEAETDEKDRIFTPLQREVALHTEREAVWDPRMWFVQDEKEIQYYWNNLIQADYILIKESMIVPQDIYSGPMYAPRESQLYALLIGEDSEMFQQVHQFQDFLIYEVNTDEL